MGSQSLVSVDVTRQNDAYVGTVCIKQTEFGIQPIKIGGGLVRVKDELEISHYERCAAFGKARPRNPPAPPLSMICRSPELYFVSCKAEGQASFCWPMGVTYADRAANYCSEWGAVRLMEVPPTSVAGLAGTSRSPAGPIITAPLNHTTMHKDGESQETNSAAPGYSDLMVCDNLACPTYESALVCQAREGAMAVLCLNSLGGNGSLGPRPATRLHWHKGRPTEPRDSLGASPSLLLSSLAVATPQSLPDTWPAS
jgi:hypothetical protein